MGIWMETSFGFVLVPGISARFARKIEATADRRTKRGRVSSPDFFCFFCFRRSSFPPASIFCPCDRRLLYRIIIPPVAAASGVFFFWIEMSFTHHSNCCCCRYIHQYLITAIYVRICRVTVSGMNTNSHQTGLYNSGQRAITQNRCNALITAVTVYFVYISTFWTLVSASNGGYIPGHSKQWYKYIPGVHHRGFYR